MRNATSRLLTVALLSGATGLLALGHPAEVRAQTPTIFCPGFALLKNGQCGGDGAFSGAALAGQALSELSETTTQETSRNTLKTVAERREIEKERCAPGFSRVGGVCQPITPPARAEEAAVEPQPAPPPSARLKKAKKPKVAGIRREEEHVPAAKVVRRKETEARLRHAAVPPPAMVCKDQPCAPPPPILIEPAVRFGAWTQVFGDYERRNASGPAFVDPPAVVVPLEISVQSRTGTVGFQTGGDLTSRGVLFANDGLIAGVMAGYVRSELTLNTLALSTDFTKVSNGSSHMNASLDGPTTGLYATYFNGGFSTDFLLKVDVLTLTETFTDSLAFTGVDGGFIFPIGGTDPVPLINATVFGDLNYRFDLYPNFWIEPTVGAQYTNTSYTRSVSQIGLDDGALVMVQGGARFGTSTLIDNHTLMTTTLTGLAYDDVLVAGGFIPGLAFQGNNLLAHADQGQVRGRGILAFNFDFGQGLSSYVLADVRGGKGLFGAGGKAGVRYQW